MSDAEPASSMVARTTRMFGGRAHHLRPAPDIGSTVLILIPGLGGHQRHAAKRFGKFVGRADTFSFQYAAERRQY